MNSIDRLGPDGFLERQQEQEVDIGSRRQGAATITADGGDSDAGMGRRMGRVEDVIEHEVMQDGDQLVLQPGDPLGAFQAAAIFEQKAAGLRAPFADWRRERWPARPAASGRGIPHAPRR